MAKTSKKANQTSANIGFEKQIWDAACVLWTDNQEMAQDTPHHDVRYAFKEDVPIAADGDAQYGRGSAANRLEG